MRTRLQKWSLLLGAAAVLALPLASWAQLTTFDIETRIGMESHIGNLTGHAKDAKGDYRRYCVGCHGDLGDGNGENAAWVDTPMYQQPATSSWASLSAAPLRPEPCRRTRIFSTPSLAASTAPICRSGTPSTKQERADLVAWVKHFSPRWTSEKPGTPITIPPEPEVTPERIKAGREVFARVQCWKCHGVQGMANGPSASTLTDDLGRPIAPFNFTDGSRPKCGDTDTGYLPDLHDRSGWHSDAVVCRQHQAR